VHVYQDGSIHLNHGGTEMGQGLNTKVAQVLAEEFQVDLDTIRITATTTGKVPNTSATAASSGTDLNGMAAANAAQQIKTRLVAFASEKFSVPAEQVEFIPNHVRIGNELMAVRRFHQARLSGADPAFCGGLLQDPGNPLGPRQRQGPAVLLFRLWRGGLGGLQSIR
jgi:xanthine dehydrogenase molybdopterin-binding subunit B